ncbi:MAG: hypothetical protein ACUZ8H_14200 [Candidatus Anammoxibacter sp.]
MTNVKNVFLDVGDIYTKFHVVDEHGNLEYNVCLPTIAKKVSVSNKTCSCFKDTESGSYMTVGMDAAYDLGYDDIIDLRFKAKTFDVINKILFDYIDDNATVNIYLISAEPDDDIQFDKAAKIYKDYDFPVKGFVNGVYITKRYTINLAGRMVSDILASYFGESAILENHGRVIVVDIGFKKTKLFIIDTNEDNVVFKNLFHGFDYYLVKLKGHFEEAGINVHPFIVLNELERNNFIIDTDEGTYDISKIIENARFDLSKAIIAETEDALKAFYNSFLVWPGFLYITGGGAVLCGDVIKADLASRYDQFTKGHLVESRPRDYLVRTCIQMS